MNKHDAHFLRNFSLMIAGFMLFTLLLIIGAYWANARFYGQGARSVEEAKGNALAAERIEARLERTRDLLAPLGQVYAGDTGRAALLAAQEAAKQAAASKVAYDGTLDGAVIYQRLCSACHQTGAGGAPAATKEAWAPRIAKGIDTLVKNAIEGFQGQSGLMPARGGNPALTDEQVRVTVQYMVDKYSK